MKINAASAVAPVATHKRALEDIAKGVEDEILGPISMDHVQICPQHAGYIHEELIMEFMSIYPSTAFRLHASPKISGYGRRIVHVSNSAENMDYLNEAIRLGEIMGSHGHTIHAGERQHCSMEQMIENLERLQQKTSMPVGVEGLYPSKNDRWLMSSWQDHELVLKSGSLYALDLSHLNIVAKAHGRNDSLVEEMLASPQCIEVHVSGNDGRADSHKPLDKSNAPWWLTLLRKTNPAATIFYEGILVDPRKSKRQAS